MSLIKIHLDRQTPKDKPKKKAYESGLKYYSEKENRLFRSTWEIFLAETLTSLGIKYLYEPERKYFKAEKESYLCDFFLPDYNVWVEVKGWMDKRSARRIKLFLKYYSGNTGFFLVEKEEMELFKENPELIFTYIEIAQEEMRRVQNGK
ncbi:hypothetical protein [Bacillus anthracis]